MKINCWACVTTLNISKYSKYYSGIKLNAAENDLDTLKFKLRCHVPYVRFGKVLREFTCDKAQTKDSHIS